MPTGTATSLGYAPYVYRERASHKMLFIGNSFTFFNDVPGLIQTMGQELGLNIACKSFTESSQTLLLSSQSSDPLGLRIAKEIVAAGNYTDVILQEQSSYPIEALSLFRKGANALRKEITWFEPDASFHLYGTWAYASLALGHNKSIPDCELLIRNSIEGMALTLGADVGEVGKAFTYVYRNYPAIDLYYSDAKHPSFAGSYLSALVQLATYTRTDVRKVVYAGKEGTSNDYGETYIPADNAALLRDVAYRVAFNQI
jgi:hypothetical protein